MISWRALTALAAAIPLLAGCSGADALKAQQLLKEAQQAQQTVSSETFSAHLSVAVKGQQFQLQLSGGGYQRGASAGDMYVDMRLSAPVGLPFSTMRVAKVGGSEWLELDGRRLAVPPTVPSTVPSTTAQGGTANPALVALDFTRYVKDVKVGGGQVLNGRAVTKIVGVLDTVSLLNAFAKLDGLSQATGTSMPSFAGHVSDTRVVVYLDDRTHMLVAALADLKFHTSDGDPTMHLDLAITGVNKPVALPAAT